MGFERAQSRIVNLADPLAGQAKPVTDLLAAVVVKVNGKEDTQIPVIQESRGRGYVT